ncbi:MAG: Phenylacetic acid catabolic protein, partial [Myxococcota bacterium]
MCGARAPTLERKLGLAAKVQDEIGHAQLLYRLLADLGVSVDEALARLRSGRAKFHWFFHFLAEDWAATGMIAWLSDMAAAIAQGDLAGGSYAPYRRALAKICWEEQFHISYGHEVVRALAQGTAVQRAMVQNALDLWWPRLLAFNGPPTRREDD